MVEYWTGDGGGAQNNDLVRLRDAVSGYVADVVTSGSGVSDATLYGGSTVYIRGLSSRPTKNACQVKAEDQ